MAEQMLLSRSVLMLVDRTLEIYAERNVTVSTARFVVDGDTYSLANVASCRIRSTMEIDKDESAKKQNLKALGWIAVAIGLLGGVILYFVSSDILGYLVGILGIGGGIASWAKSGGINPSFTLHHLRIGTSTGEQDVLASPDEQSIRQVDRAINDALVQRG